MAELLLRFKTRLVRRIPLDKPMVRVGRDGTADIAIDNPSVSRSHCFLSWVDGRWRVTDTGSENGTYVNGAKVTEYVLTPGDRIELGLFNLTLSESSEGISEADLAQASGPAPVVEGLGSTVALSGDDIQAMLRSYQQEVGEAAAPGMGVGVPAPDASPAARVRSAPVVAAPEAGGGSNAVQRVVLVAGVMLIVVGVVLWALDLV